MSVPAILAVVMIIVFRKYVTDREFCRQSAYVFLGHVALLLIIAAVLWANQTGRTTPSLEDSRAFDLKFKEWMVLPSIIVVALFRKKVFNRNSFYFPVFAGAVALAVIYPGVNWRGILPANMIAKNKAAVEVVVKRARSS